MRINRNNKLGHINMRFTTLSLTAIATAIAMPSAAYAEDGPITEEEEGEIIVTGERVGYVATTSAGLKTPTPLIDTPQTVSVITKQQLDDQSLQDIADILRYTPGVSTGQGEGHRDQITIRGQNTTADFFQDGVRDDVQYYRPLYNIERVEIHKGPNAMIFGRGGGGGAINRVSKSPLIDTSKGEVVGSVDSFGAFYVTGDYNYGGENYAFRLNALYEDFNNHRDFYNGSRFAINPTVGVELGEKTNATLSYEYIDDDRVVDRGIPSFNNVPIPDNRDTFFGIPGTNVTTLKAHIIKLRLNHEFNDDLSFNSSTIYADYDKLYQNIYSASSDLSAATPTVTLDGYRDTTDRKNFITQGNLIWTGDTGSIGHTLLLGYEFGDQETSNARRDVLFDNNSDGIFDSTISVAGLPDDDDRSTIALTRPILPRAFQFPVFNRNRASDLRFVSLYIQDQIAISDNLDIIAGVRFDSFDIKVNDIANVGNFARKDNKFSPRFGVVFKPQENISLYTSYAKSFLPRSGDQFLSLSLSTAALEPESFDNYEVGVKWDINKGLNLTAAIFRLDRDNQAVATDNNGTSAFQGSRTDGFELQLVGQLTPNWQINAGYSYLDATETGRLNGGTFDNRRIGQVPEHMASLWTRYDVTERFGFGAGVTHQSSQFARTNSAVLVPSYTRVDAAAYYDVNDNFGLQLNVENLFDTEYFPAVHNASNIATGEPFNARVTARIKF